MIPRRYFSPGSRARGINLAVYLKAQLQRAEQECPMVALMSRLYQATGRDSLFSFRQASSNLTGVYDVTDTSLIPNVNMSRMKPNQHELITPPTALGMCTKTVKREGETHKTRDIDESDYSDSSEDNTSGSMFVESGQEGLNVNLTSVCSDTERRCEDRTGLTYGLLSKERKYDLEPHLNVYGSEAAVRPKVNLTEDRSCNNQADLERVTESGISLKSIPGSEPVIRPPKIHISEVQTDSFDMEEVQSHDGENAEKGTSRPLFPLKLLVRGASQQSDSSGFTEDYPLEKSIHAKVQSDKDTDNHLATKGTSSHLLPVKVLIRGASQQSDSSGFTEDYQIDTCIHPKVQSKESENHMGMKGTPKHLLPLKALVRGASQQSDSSGFTDDYPVEKSIHHKVNM
ncbi:protein ITPRID2 isoform X2 [Esox lucius]|uniref:protein ITPRID2 isoform X2 n=1 Tax=Esox lucius TaxID=8010 RepID=UPI001476D424|nr:protein ITPRID2 isoform X2 [Esox lucius]